MKKLLSALVIACIIAGAIVFNSYSSFIIPAAHLEPGLGPTQPVVESTQLDKDCLDVYGHGHAHLSDLSHLDYEKPGNRLWQIRGRGLLEFPPVLCDGILYVNNIHGQTFAIEASSGRQLWRKQTSERYAASPAISGDLLVLAALDGQLQVLNRHTGQRLWMRNISKTESSPIVYENTIYVGAYDGRLYAIDLKSGHTRWSFYTGGKIHGSPAISNNKVCNGNYAGQVFCLDLASGKPLWIKRFIRPRHIMPEHFYATPVIHNDNLYMTAVSGGIWSFDLNNGQTNWSKRFDAMLYAKPAISHNRLFLGTYGHEILSLDLHGRELWRQEVNGRISGAPVVIGKNVYVSTLSSKSYGFNAQSGQIAWEHDAGRYVTGIAADGRFYLTLNGLLAAFEPAEEIPVTHYNYNQA